MRTAGRASMRMADRTSTDSTSSPQFQPEFQPQPSLSPSLFASMVDRRTLQQPIDRVAPAPMQANRVRRSIVAPGSGALAAVLRYRSSENHPMPSNAQRRGAPVRMPLSVTGRHESASSFGSAAGSEQRASAFQPGSRPVDTTPRLQRSLDRRPQRRPVADLGDRFLRELSQTSEGRRAP